MPKLCSGVCSPATTVARLPGAAISLSTPSTSAHRAASDTWWIQSLVGVLRLDTERISPFSAELTERRTIVFERDDIEELFCEFSLPRRDPGSDRAHELDIRVDRGGALREILRPAPEVFQFVVELPRRFRAGDKHEYDMRFRIPPGQPMAPHYVLQPFVPCESFSATICFPAARPPREVWLVPGVAPRMLTAELPSGPAAPVDRLGQVHCAFRDLSPGRAYGLKWRCD